MKIYEKLKNFIENKYGLGVIPPILIIPYCFPFFV